MCIQEKLTDLFKETFLEAKLNLWPQKDFANTLMGENNNNSPAKIKLLPKQRN